MKKDNHKIGIKKHLLLLLVIFASSVSASPLINLTEQELQFLNAHPTVVLGSDSGWAPYVIDDKNGNISGYDAEVLALINQVSGANFVLQLGKWQEITNAQEKRQIDGLSTAVTSKQRALHSNFSNSYLSLEKIIFTRKDLPYPTNNSNDLEGKKFGIYKGNIVARTFAQTIKNAQIIKFDSTQALIEGVTTGKADFMLGNAAMFYLLNKSGNPFLKPAIFLRDKPLALVFVIRNDFPEAITIINKSLQFIGQKKLLQLKNKWFSPDVNKLILFNDTEMHYLKKKKQLTLCIDPNWMPFEQLKKSKHIGMSADYFDLFREQLPIPIKLVPTQHWQQTINFAKNRECDLISLAMPTKERNSYLDFSDILFETPVVLATKPNITFVNDLAVIQNKKIGIIENYAFNEIIRNKYPNIEVVNIKDAQQGLQQVVNGELFGYIDALPTIGYMFQTKFMGELKISGKFENSWKMSIATRNDEPLLLPIINKLIKQIPAQKHQQIFNRYVSINYERGFDYQLFGEIMLFLAIISLLFLYRYRTMTAYNRRIKHYLAVIDKNVLTSSTDVDGNITEVSSALCRLTGYKKEELIGKNHNIFRHPTTKSSLYQALWSAITQGQDWRGEILNLNKNGSSYWANTHITPIYYKNGKLRGYTAILQDISDKKRLEKLTITDALTQIPNRLFINKSFNNEFARSKRYHSHFSLILMDIDNFKQVNDNYGHKVGDDILINIAIILKQNIRQLDLLGRWGGEEFLIICPETDLQQAKVVAEKIRELIEHFEFTNIPQLTCSFGVALSRSDDNKEALFQRADNALYDAKNAGRNRVKLEKIKKNSL
ncbi:diguanylate cyclase [Psychromonas hadalis]|uniref:diguanylate cyclase n=1 Tax=Psychromonas hadalis TaxID=211669 RepID=UPI0003B50D4B|nr:transporter substrate-binding domain-containing protein [Psychromonas hadalis]